MCPLKADIWSISLVTDLTDLFYEFYYSLVCTLVLDYFRFLLSGVGKLVAGIVFPFCYGAVYKLVINLLCRFPTFA